MAVPLLEDFEKNPKQLVAERKACLPSMGAETLFEGVDLESQSQ
jgi:hypothetical protein